MKTFLTTLLGVGVAAAVLVYLGFQYAEVPTHIHFTSRDGALTRIIFYSDRRPETVSDHECDGRFAEMPDHLFPRQWELWRERYGGEGAPTEPPPP